MVGEAQDAQDAGHGRPQAARRRRIVVLVVVLVVAGGVGVWLLGDAGGGGTGADGSPDGGAAVVERDDVALTGVQLTSLDDGIDPATGLPTDERDSYAVGEGARLWVQFSYTGDAPGQDALFVRWYRDDEEIFQSSWRLPQPVENHNVALGSSYTDEPGGYRVEVLLNGEVLHTADFSVG